MEKNQLQSVTQHTKEMSEVAGGVPRGKGGLFFY